MLLRPAVLSLLVHLSNVHSLDGGEIGVGVGRGHGQPGGDGALLDRAATLTVHGIVELLPLHHHTNTNTKYIHIPTQKLYSLNKHALQRKT